jgi:hypothetical protein
MRDALDKVNWQEIAEALPNGTTSCTQASLHQAAA